MNKKKSEFDKVFNAWDILVIAFGAMIGWGWVVSSGDWIQRGGVLGAVIGFALGGIMIFFVGLTYAELTSAMPQCGGEHVFSYKAMGPVGSFICTWAIVLGYVSVVCFEACALPTIIQYIYPGFLKGYMYTVAGFDVIPQAAEEINVPLKKNWKNFDSFYCISCNFLHNDYSECRICYEFIRNRGIFGRLWSGNGRCHGKGFSQFCYV